eukprot:5970233-Pyramimonas_sp.AAC.2
MMMFSVRRIFSSVLRKPTFARESTTAMFPLARMGKRERLTIDASCERRSLERSERLSWASDHSDRLWAMWCSNSTAGRGGTAVLKSLSGSVLRTNARCLSSAATRKEDDRLIV